ncbi:peroxisomal membrane protein 4-like [Mantella aurantiaca]
MLLVLNVTGCLGIKVVAAPSNFIELVSQGFIIHPPLQPLALLALRLNGNLLDVCSPPLSLPQALTCSEAMCNAAELEPALKGYGAKIRAPHALVMTFLFKSGSLKDKLKAIFQATFTHSRNLAYFVFTYKSILTAQEKIHGSKWQFHSFLAACVGGWVVFGENNTINSQINMYLLSRVLFGMSRLAVEKGFIPEPKCDVFPFFSALVWGLVLWMFEYHRHTLQPSLQSSMTYLYDDSNIWHDISDFLIYNKPKQEK